MHDFSPQDSAVAVGSCLLANPAALCWTKSGGKYDGLGLLSLSLEYTVSPKHPDPGVLSTDRHPGHSNSINHIISIVSNIIMYHKIFLLIKMIKT